MTTPYRCPLCRCDDRLRVSGSSPSETWCCDACGARYPVVCGIADLRIAADPYIGIEADRAKARGLAERFDDLDLAGLIDHYFAITPEVPRALAARYRVGLLESGPARVEGLLALSDEWAGHQPPSARVLELACGSGPFFPTLADRFERIVGVDIALRWLVVARKRLIEGGIAQRVQLVCACAEALPFDDGAFDLAIAANALEHVQDADRALGELRRVLADDGSLALTTPNRFSPGPDPHVGLWGIGFLPRSWQDRIAWRLRGTGLERIHTRGRAELRRLLSDAGLTHCEFALPAASDADLKHRSGLVRLLGRLYNTLRGWPIARPLLLRFGPLFQIVAKR